MRQKIHHGEGINGPQAPRPVLLLCRGGPGTGSVREFEGSASGFVMGEIAAKVHGSMGLVFEQAAGGGQLVIRFSICMNLQSPGHSKHDTRPSAYFRKQFLQLSIHSSTQRNYLLGFLRTKMN